MVHNKFSDMVNENYNKTYSILTELNISKYAI